MNDLERRLRESLLEVRDAGRIGADARQSVAKQRLIRRIQRRRRFTVAGAAVAAGAAAVGAFVFFSTYSGTQPAPNRDLGPVTIPGPARAVVEVGDGPTALSVGGLRYVWSANTAGESVSRIDPATNQEILEVDLGSRPSDIGIGRGPVWVALPETGEIVEVDPQDGAIRNNVAVAEGPVDDIDLSVGAGALWAVVRGDHVSRVDPESLEVERFTVAASPTDVGVRGDVVRVLDSAGVIYQLDAVTGEEVGPPLEVDPHEAGNLTYAAGSLWFFADAGDAVTRLDPATGEVLGRVDPEGTVVDFVIDPDVAWILTRSDESGSAQPTFLLTAVDRETTAAVGEPIPVEGEPAAMVIAGKSLWLSLTAEDIVLRFSKYR